MIAIRAADVCSSLHIGVEMTAVEANQPLGFERLLIGGEGLVGHRQMIAESDASRPNGFLRRGVIGQRRAAQRDGRGDRGARYLCPRQGEFRAAMETNAGFREQLRRYYFQRY